MELNRKRILVTGGAGFLGRHVVRFLQASGSTDVIVPRKAHYDLVHEDAVERLYREEQPQVVIHLAAVVGGIGANRAHPGQFLYENLVMGAMLLEYARQNGAEKFVRRYDLFLSEVRTHSVSRGEPVGWLSRGNECTLRASEENAARSGASLSAAIWDECH